MELTKRKQNILASIVDGYIRTGEPVGSKSIAEKAGVSSATVRNEMAELTELGLLEQPHTSAGRVPSQEGYREFVDALMQPETLTEAEKLTIDAMLAKSAFDPERLLRGAAKTLAASTRYLALSTTPSGADAKIKAVQFVQTSRRTAMLIMMSSAGTMKNKVFHCDFDLSNEIMRIFFRVLNERVTHYCPGCHHGIIHKLVAESLVALAALLEVALETMQTEISVSGQMNLLFYPEYKLGGARRVMDILERRELLTELLAGKQNRTQIKIGTETGQNALAESSVICSRYSVNGRDAGAVAVIGPMRMQYAHVAAQTAYVADRVGEMLTRIMREE